MARPKKIKDLGQETTKKKRGRPRAKPIKKSETIEEVVNARDALTEMMINMVSIIKGKTAKDCLNEAVSDYFQKNFKNEIES